MLVSIAWRSFEAHDHYVGTEYQPQRQSLDNFVINHQNLWDLSATVGIKGPLSILVDIPYVDNGWSVHLPNSPPLGPRYQQHVEGLGDIVIEPQVWLLGAQSHPHTNIQLGLGLKIPTGNDRSSSVYPDKNGQNPMLKPNDVSIQPGDGGWGIDMSMYAYKDLAPLRWFVAAEYLANPRDTNGVPSIGASINPPSSQPAASLQVNSVPDQYLYRLGFTASIPWVKGLTGMLDVRDQGVPQRDLIGATDGFRRPGYSISVEPGLTYGWGASSVSLSVPITLVRNRLPTISAGQTYVGDATFAKDQVIVSYTRRVKAW